MDEASRQVATETERPKADRMGDKGIKVFGVADRYCDECDPPFVNRSRGIILRSRIYCFVCAIAAVLPLPVFFVLELTTRDTTFRSSGPFGIAMLLLYLSTFLIFPVALILCIRWAYLLYSTQKGIHPRHVIAVMFVSAIHGIYIVGFLLSPWPSGPTQ